MNVRDAMNSTLITAAPTATVAEAARLMLDHNLDGLPVVDDTGALLGMVTRSDLVAKHARVHLPLYFSILGTVLPIERRQTGTDIRRALAVTVQDLMEEDVPTISPDAGVDDAATLMVDRRANPIPVMEDGRLVGIISEVDIIRILLLEEGDDDELPGRS